VASRRYRSQNKKSPAAFFPTSVGNQQKVAEEKVCVKGPSACPELLHPSAAESSRSFFPRDDPGGRYLQEVGPDNPIPLCKLPRCRGGGGMNKALLETQVQPIRLLYPPGLIPKRRPCCYDSNAHGGKFARHLSARLRVIERQYEQ